MRHSVHLIHASVLFVAALPALCQPIKPVQLAFEGGCGNPMIESQLWLGVSGTVLSVTKSGSIEVHLSEASAKVTVHLAGISRPKDRNARAAFERFIRANVGGEPVVMLMPSDWTFASAKPRAVIATITLKTGSDLGLLLIESRVAQFLAPPPYKMSRYLSCLYRHANQAALAGTHE